MLDLLIPLSVLAVPVVIWLVIGLFYMLCDLTHDLFD